jgi:hypothetical protein
MKLMMIHFQYKSTLQQKIKILTSALRKLQKIDKTCKIGNQKGDIILHYFGRRNQYSEQKRVEF